MGAHQRGGSGLAGTAFHRPMMSPGSANLEGEVSRQAASSNSAPRPRLSPAGQPYVVLTGNPNCGKTTLFNALTGLRAKVGNYAGVTVERKEGTAAGRPPDAKSRCWTCPALTASVRNRWTNKSRATCC